MCAREKCVVVGLIIFSVRERGGIKSKSFQFFNEKKKHSNVFDVFFFVVEKLKIFRFKTPALSGTAKAFTFPEKGKRAFSVVP